MANPVNSTFEEVHQSDDKLSPLSKDNESSPPRPQQQQQELIDTPDAETTGGQEHEEEEKGTTGGDEAARIESLAATARDQDEIEKEVGRQADRMLIEQADERDQKRLEKTLSQKAKLVSQIQRLQQRLREPSSTTASAAARIRAEIQHLEPQLTTLNTDVEQIQKRMEERKKEEVESAADADQGGNTRRPGESRRDFLIRTGKITPFSKMGLAQQKVSANLADVMLDAEDAGGSDSEAEEGELDESSKHMSHQNLLMPGFADDAATQTDSTVESIDDRPRKKRRVRAKGKVASRTTEAPQSQDDLSSEEFNPDADASTGDEEDTADFSVIQEGRDGATGASRKRKSKTKARRRQQEEDEDLEDGVGNLEGIDDGDERVYFDRLKRWTKDRRAARSKAQSKRAEQQETTEADLQTPASGPGDGADEEEWLMPHPSRPDTPLGDDFRIPGDIYPSLFDYQKTGVQWLWELYSQQVGGIVGDEMGLGKTIQVIAFLAGLHHSGKLKQPIIVVTPATVMKQWVNEFHRWWPPLRVSILHTSGSGMMDVRSERAMEDRLEADRYDDAGKSSKGNKTAKKIVDRVVNQGHVLVTTYSGLQSYAELLLPIQWGYAVLDEGHKIRNPNAKITIFCKSLRTSNRVILSGTPMQNNLTELWSLFDFIFPLRLGTLVSFRTQFEIPIKQGGYANASNLQVETALQCAEALKDTISPYLLQRFKIDVAADLPKKTEQVLFCRLTKLQRQAYEMFLSSGEMTSILNGKRQALFGIDILRKICNHPDLQDHRNLSVKPGYNYGAGGKSGKMQVVKALLQLWRDTGHKTLLFAQHRIMLDILEKFLNGQKGFNFRRMDGTTPIKDRQNLVDEFNRNPDLHVFLLTTKVGGLGVNLTGADRVLIYDPDWNPSTDMQARERSWRLGQKREVMIYRLMTAGTIEEKIYHRQIFKQFLTNKILRDPKQRQTFQLKDLHDLFTLGNANDDATETGGLFKGTEVKFDNVTTEDQHLPTPPQEEKDFETQSIVGISHRAAFENGEDKSSTKCAGEDGSGSTTCTAPANNNDSRLLSSIFARSGVHSALEHDAIIGGAGKSKVTADPVIIAQEAKRVAAEAARALQRAGETARNVPAGVPTWTGIYGSGGRVEEPPQTFSRGRGGTASGRGSRGGSSSAAILAGLSARQQSDLNESRGSTPAIEQPRGKDFMKLIRDYLVAHGGSVYTQMLIDHFNRFCGTEERTAEFKEMLRTIAVMERGADPARGGPRGRSSANRDRSRGGRAKWVLRPEFA